MEEKFTQFLFALNRINSKLKELSDELNALTTEFIKADFDDDICGAVHIDMLSTHDYE
jgi:hypothetical protein